MFLEPTKSIARWFDSSIEPSQTNGEQIDWVRVVPFALIHISCLAVLIVGWSWVALGLALAMYFVRMFAITGFYHRYFSHRSFNTTRWLQTVFAIVANSSGQRGPLWWASHHRNHHLHSDEEPDEHSPRWRGFLKSHVGWFLTRKNFATDKSKVGDWAKFPELRFIDRFDSLVPAMYFAGTFAIGEFLAAFAPSLGTDGWQLVIWAGSISTVAVMHATFCINSFAHGVGNSRFDTGDDSGNSLILALITFGEGWHNNHHRYPISCRQGFYWWEWDLTYYVLKSMSWVGLVSDLRAVPDEVYAEAEENEK